MIISFVFILVFGGIITIWSGDKISFRLFGFVSKLFCVDMILNILAQLIIRYYSLTYRMQFKSKEYGLLTIAMQFVNKLFVLIAAFMTENIDIIITINALGAVLIALLLLTLRKGDIVPRKVRYVSLKNVEIYKFAIFSAPMPILINLNTVISQDIITRYLDNSALGVYASANYFTNLLIVIQSGFTTYWSAYMYANYKEKQEQIKKVHECLLFVVILFYSFLIIFKDLLYLLIGNEYHESKKFFAAVIFFPILSLMSETTTYGLSLKNKNHIKLLAYGCCVILNLIFAKVLVPQIGLSGAAYASAISGLIYYLICTITSHYFYVSISSVKKSIIGICTLVIILFVGCNVSNHIYIVVLIIIDIVMAFIFKDEIQLVLKEIRKIKKENKK